MLHTVNKSPFMDQTLASCLRLASAGSSILLIEDAVYAAVKNTAFSETILQAAKDYSVYALQADLEARGLTTDHLLDVIQITDYHGFVELSIRHDKVLAW